MSKSTKTPPGAAVQRHAFGYSRVSSGQQADSGISLAEQDLKIRARCAENGWDLKQVFVDAGISGSTPLGKRPQGRALLSVVKPGDAIVSTRMDRLFRSSLNALETIENFKRRKIGLLLLDLGDVTDSSIAQLIASVLAATAQFERGLISERQCDAKAQLRRQGRHQGGSRPFGWTVGTARGHATALIPDLAEQAAIAEMVTMREGGSSLMAIRNAIRRQGHRISQETVRRVCERHAATAEAAE